MTKRMIFPLIFGIAGIAVLLWLGFWQLQRLEWKQDIIAQIDTRLNAEPIPLLGQYKRPDADRAPNYTRVTFEGRVTNNEAHVYAPQKSGLGYRVVSEFWWNNKNFFVDLGWIPEAEKDIIRPTGPMRVTGYISWPDDYDPKFTPDPDLGKNIWFSRFITPMAMHMGVTSFLVVAQKTEIRQNGEWVPYSAVEPLPISINIKNDHWEYAITWFSLASVWFGMTLYLLYRIKQKTV